MSPARQTPSAPLKRQRGTSPRGGVKGNCVSPNDVFREVIHRRYRIVYMHLEDEDRVEVLTVFHSSRQFGALPGDVDD